MQPVLSDIDLGVDDALDIAMALNAPELDVVAIGPLTNLALAERKSPGILNRARRVVAMGAALWCGGNITDTSEYNIYADPHALSELLQALTNLTLIPLDVTEQLTLT